MITEPIADEPLWDAEQVARFLNVTRRAVYRASAAGALPFVRVGALKRFQPATVRAFVSASTTGSLSELRQRFGDEP